MEYRLNLVLCLIGTLYALQKNSEANLFQPIDHRCKLESETSDASYKLTKEILRQFFPLNKNRNDYSQCQYFADDDNEKSDEKVLKCSKYIFDETKSSAIETFSLICDRAELKTLSDCCYAIFVIVGYLLAGFSGDVYQTKSLLQNIATVHSILNVFIVLSPWLGFPIMFISRTLVAGTASGLYVIAFSLITELAGENIWYAGIFYMIFASSGEAIVEGLKIIITDWRMIHLAVIGFSCILTIILWKVKVGPPPEGDAQQVDAQQVDAPPVAQVTLQSKPETEGTILREIPSSSQLNGNDSLAREENNNYRQASIFRNIEPLLRTKVQHFLMLFLISSVASGATFALTWKFSGILRVKSFKAVTEVLAFALFLLIAKQTKEIEISAAYLAAPVFLNFAGAMLLLSLYFAESIFVVIGYVSITASCFAIFMRVAGKSDKSVRSLMLGFAFISARVGAYIIWFCLKLSEWDKISFICIGVMALVVGTFFIILNRLRN